MNCEAHVSFFGAAGESLRLFADKEGYIVWDGRIHEQAKRLSMEELESELALWERELDSSDWGDPAPGKEGSDNPEDYPDYMTLLRGATAYAVEKAVRGIEQWRNSGHHN